MDFSFEAVASNRDASRNVFADSVCMRIAGSTRATFDGQTREQHSEVRGGGGQGVGRSLFSPWILATSRFPLSIAALTFFFSLTASFSCFADRLLICFDVNFRLKICSAPGPRQQTRCGRHMSR